MAAPLPGAHSRWPAYHILLVDDEPDTLTMFRDALEGSRAREMRAAANGPVR